MIIRHRLSYQYFIEVAYARYRDDSFSYVIREHKLKIRFKVGLTQSLRLDLGRYTF